MGSLQDQLLKAGLVSEQQLKENRSKKRKTRKRNKGKKESSEPSLAAAYAKRAQQEKTERDRELNRRREEARKRKERKAQLRQLIVPNRRNDDAADVPRHFDYLGKIRKLYVTKRQFEDVNTGRLAIVYHAGRFHLLERAHIDKVMAIDPAVVAFDAKASGSADDVAEGYEDEKFQVPDDLIW